MWRNIDYEGIAFGHREPEPAQIVDGVVRRDLIAEQAADVAMR